MEDYFVNEKAIIKWTMIIIISILLIIGGIEILGYRWEKNLSQGSMGWTLVASRRLKIIPTGTDSTKYYILKPNTDYSWDNIPVHINSQGFRTPEFDISKGADTFRILNIGDSIGFGWSVRLEDTYGQILARELNEPAQSRTRIEIINAAVPAWNLDSELNFLMAKGFSYQPDLVLLDFTILNDIYGGGFVEPESGSTVQWLKDHTYSWSFITTNIRFLMAKRVGPEAIPALNPPANAEAYYPLDENDPIYANLWQYIQEMASACEQRDIPFLLVIFPTAYQVNSQNHPNIPQRAITRLAKENDIPIIDLLPVFSQVCDDAGGGACEGYDNLIFADIWMHPNLYGHQIAARQIEDFLFDHDLVGQ